MVVGWILVIAMVLFWAITFYVHGINTLFDRGHWEYIGTKPDYNAKIVNIYSYEFNYTGSRKVRSKLRTDISFYDGYVYVSYKHRVKNLDLFGVHYKLYLGEDQKEKMILAAYRSHAKAVKKALAKAKKKQAKGEAASAAAYEKIMKGLEIEQEPGASRRELLSSQNPDTVAEAREIYDHVQIYLQRAKGLGQNIRLEKRSLLVNEYRAVPGAVGCFRTEEGWALYEIEEDLELWVRGPFSKEGMITALAKTMKVPESVAPMNFTDREIDRFLAKPLPIARYEANLQKHRK